MPRKGPLEICDGVTRNKSAFMKVATFGAMLSHTEEDGGGGMSLVKDK